MANKTTGSGQWTNMGNVTTNPDGSYSDSKTYNFLDMVSYEGGSYAWKTGRLVCAHLLAKVQTDGSVLQYREKQLQISKT